MPSTMAVTMPVSAAGMTTCRIVCQRVEPSASDPVRISCGTVAITSYEIDVIVGRIMSDRTIEPANQEKPSGTSASRIASTQSPTIAADNPLRQRLRITPPPRY